MITNMFIKMIIWHDPKFSAMEKKLARTFTKITEINDVHFLFQESKMFHQTMFFYSTLDTAIGWHISLTQAVILSFTSNFFATIAPLSNNMRPQVKSITIVKAFSPPSLPLTDLSGNTCVLQRVQKVTSVGCTLSLLIFVRLNLRDIRDLKSPAKKGAAKIKDTKFSDLYKNLYLSFLSARSKRTSRRAQISLRRMPLFLIIWLGILLK